MLVACVAGLAVGIMTLRRKEARLALKEKKLGLGLETRSFHGKDGRTYLVFRTAEGSYHVFAEVEAKEAARQCGAMKEANTRQVWGEVWVQAGE
jgi:hypothetical protein